jgi:hypothetical protein
MADRKQRTTHKLLEDLKQYLVVYPTANRERWEEKRLKAIRAIDQQLKDVYIDMKFFLDFWQAYPRKANKQDALRAWQQTTEVRPDLSVILNAIKEQSKTKSWMEGYIPHPSSWLRGHRWEDETEIKLPDVVNEKPWHETASGIEAKGLEFGLKPEQFESFPHFKTAVMRAAMKAA